MVHTIVFLLLWLGHGLSCPEECFCDKVAVDGEVGVNVNCSYASLSSLPSISAGAVILDVFGNKLEVIPPMINLLHKLRELNFSRNRLGYDNNEGIRDFAFSNLVNLKILHLSGNCLKTFSPNTFNGLVSLEKLDLYGNDIVHLPLGIYESLPNTAVICLGGNSWNCSMCQFHETLERYLSDDSNHISDVCGRGVPSCSSPPAFEMRRFTELRLENISVCVKQKPITTSPIFISTAADLSTKLSTISEASLRLIASVSTHTTTANSTTALPEFYSNSGNFIDQKTAKLVMGSSHHGFLSAKDGNKGDSQLFIAVAMVIMGVMTLTLFLLFSVMVLKMQRKYRQVNIGHMASRVDASPPVSPWPLLQGGQLMAMEANDTETMLQPSYEEIPFNCNSNHKNEHWEGSITHDTIPEIQLDQPAKNGSEQFSAKVDNPYKTVLHSQSNPMIVKLPDSSWDTSFVHYKSSKKTAATDCSGAAVLYMPLNHDNGLSQSTPYMVMHSPTEKNDMKDLYFSFET